MTLHTVNKSPLERNALESCLIHAKAGSAILLLEDGVYGAMIGTTFTPRIEYALQTLKIYALRADVDARGIREKLIGQVQLVDYGGFVDLATEHSPIVSWL
jgi:tRNA 2-thiouridine synthesizing protein B